MNKIVIDIVCPIYSGYCYLDSLYKSFLTQSNVTINKIIFPITDSEDEQMPQIREFVKKNNIESFEVKKNEFSHSLTRQKAITEYCESPIVVMLAQDIKLTSDMVFYNLVKDIHTGETAYNYAKQICTDNPIEKYIRERNYPDTSYIVSEDDIEKMQIMAFFASDACSAYDRDTFIHLGGYGGYNVMMNEDQLYSKILLDAGYKKKYCADAIVEHSHKYTLKQVYKRYYEVGLFYSEVGLFDTYKSANTGFKLALYVLCQAVKHLDIPAILRWLPDMAARYLGMKFGKIAGKNNTSNR